MPRFVVRPVQEFLHREVSSGVFLALATAAALIWANLSFESYDRFWETRLTFEVGGWGHVESLRHVVNDGLMALFFFVIGLEVKRELAAGELSDRRAATLPLLAALGGMVVPAAIYLAVTAGEPQLARGWGIPMATDIAFALGVLALVGSRVPGALKVLLLGIAVVDDIGAIIVIALFYSGGVEVWWLVLAALAVVVVVAMQRLHVRATTPYVLLGVVVWLATYESGVHATIAGVVLGLLTPVRPFQRGDAVSEAAKTIADRTADDDDDPDKDAADWRTLSWLSNQAISPGAQLEHALHPWTAMLVLPLFALANVGIAIDLSAAQAVFSDPLGLGIMAGLVLGKPLGIVLGGYVAVRTGCAQLPSGVTWRHVGGVGALAGIGFTMSLFVTTLAFREPLQVTTATFAVLVASVLAGIIGTALLLTSADRTGPGQEPVRPDISVG